MKNICVIGNSHTASLISAWNEISQNYPDITLTFFAHPSTGLFNITTSEKYIIPTSHILEKSFPINSGGKKRINVDEYDKFLLYGLLDPNDYIFNDSEYISKAVLENICLDVKSNDLTFFVLKLLRSITDKDIYLGLAPYKAHRGQIADNDLILSEKNISSLFKSLAQEFYIKYLFQPKETIIEKKFTVEDFRRDHPNLNIGNDSAFKKRMPDDLKHMNKEYGVLWLKNILGNAEVSDEMVSSL